VLITTVLITAGFSRHRTHHRQSATSRHISQSPGQQARLALGVQVSQ
jgi:hypothetical protein